jgi:all-trans-retinol dehydrogenase (NAD+)
MSEIEGENILITGGASGIGRLVALEMARLGGNILIWDIHRRNLNKVLEEIGTAAGRPAHGYVCDVTKRAEVYETAERVKVDHGPVDILINNAGTVSGKTLLEIPDREIEATMAVNCLALFWTTKAFLPAMMERNHGHLVTIASAAGVIGVAKLTDYSASKWAAVGFDESLRVELKRAAPGVKTTLVCPYFTDTGMFEGVKTRFSFLLPILKEDYVAEHIVKAVRRNRRRLMMPRLVYTVPVLRALPTFLFDAVATLFGINVSMDDFTGRRDAD